MPAFNGAAAYKPRRGTTSSKYGRSMCSSMGPRLINRGEARIQTSGTLHAIFNGAAAYKPRRGLQHNSTTQSTHTFNGAAAYKPRRGTGRSLRCVRMWPSMGPRLINRGELAARSAGAEWSGPSMGPRLINRGEGGYTQSTCFPSQYLQWGRGL